MLLASCVRCLDFFVVVVVLAPLPQARRGGEPVHVVHIYKELRVYAGYHRHTSTGKVRRGRGVGGIVRRCHHCSYNSCYRRCKG